MLPTMGFKYDWLNMGNNQLYPRKPHAAITVLESYLWQERSSQLMLFSFQRVCTGIYPQY